MRFQGLWSSTTFTNVVTVMTKFATLADGVKYCVESHTKHVLRYRKLLLNDKSGMMNHQTSYHDGIKPLFIRHCDL